MKQKSYTRQLDEIVLGLKKHTEQINDNKARLSWTRRMFHDYDEKLKYTEVKLKTSLPIQISQIAYKATAEGLSEVGNAMKT